MRRVWLVLVCLLMMPGGVSAQTPTAGGQRTVGGPGLDYVPAPETAKVSVVSYGELDSHTIPVIVRNGTDGSIAGVLVRVEARDSSGKLVGTAESDFPSILPTVVPPDGVAIGYVYLDGDIPSDSTFKFNVEYEDAAGSLGRSFIDLQAGDINGFEDRIVGEMRNSSSKIVESASFMVVCVNAQGLPLSSHLTNTQSTTSPGSPIPFQVDLGSDTGTCDYYIAAGYGRL